MVDIVIAPPGEGPFAVELAVFEEDTWLLLSAGNVAHEPRRQTQELIGEMTNFEPPVPGELIIKGNLGYGVVHDLDESPSCQIAWVRQVLDQLVGYCCATGIRSLALEPLGCVHGLGNVEDFVAELSQVPGIEHLTRIWVVSHG